MQLQRSPMRMQPGSPLAGGYGDPSQQQSPRPHLSLEQRQLLAQRQQLLGREQQLLEREQIARAQRGSSYSFN